MLGRRLLIISFIMDTIILYVSFLTVLLGLDTVLSLFGHVIALFIASLVLLVAGYVTGSLTQRYAKGVLQSTGVVLVAALAALLLVYLSVPLYDIDTLVLSLLLLAPVLVTACTRILLSGTRYWDRKVLKHGGSVN